MSAENSGKFIHDIIDELFEKAREGDAASIGVLLLMHSNFINKNDFSSGYFVDAFTLKEWYSANNWYITQILDI